jgi:probable F420-dependent oxidoreductase
MTVTHRTFRFGTGFELRNPQTLQNWRDLARKTEDLGFATLLLLDHPMLAAVFPMLVAAADATTTLHVGTYFSNNTLRHPAVLANEIATLDVLSNGRVELGLGAGNPFPGEFEAFGLTNDAPGVKVRKLEEAVQVIKGFFSHEPFTFSGQYYSINELTGFPATIQRPHPPIHMAAGQERTLTLAAHHADIITVQPPVRASEAHLPVTLEAMDRQIARLRELAGDRFSSLELCTQIRITITSGSAQESPSDGKPRPENFGSVTGSVEQICEQLYAYRERFGFSYFVLRSDNMEALAPIVTRLTGK